MQDKVKPESNAKEATYVGSDVCKERLDVALHPQGLKLSVSNDAGGWRKLKRTLAAYQVERIVMESTSKYHRAAHRSLATSGFAVTIVNPLRSRFYARGIGQLAKTDQVDAAMLALMARESSLHVTAVLDKEIEDLKELVNARTAAIDERTAITLRKGSVTVKLLKTALEKMIKHYDGLIEKLDAAIAALVQTVPALARKAEIITSIPGFGRVTSHIMVAAMSEIGLLGPKQLTALAGLAPFAHDSGPHAGKRRIESGRPLVRRALFMVALVASRHNHDLKIFYQRLLKAGKAKKQALVAVARKILLLANTLVSEDRLWEKRHAA